MNVEEYLEATNAETTGGTISQNSDGGNTSDDNLSLNDPHDIQKNLARFEGIDSSHLRGEIAQALGVEYLGEYPKDGDDCKQITGKMIDPNHRWMVAIPCRRETPCPPGVNLEEFQLPSFRQVIFVVDTSSPHSYLSVEAMQRLFSGGSDNDDNNNQEDDNLSTSTIPDFMDVELRNGTKVEFHLSPGSNEEVNILGATVLEHADISTNVKDKEFVLSFVE